MTLLALLPLFFAPQETPALLALPAGWRSERLEFPLDFAPELGLEGIEDLAFAPGMFVPDSDSYWSYALALRLVGDVELDRAFLEHFLETYYRGLCRAVAEGKNLELDLDSVSAEVRPAGDGFRARVALFDAFVTGEALELELELATHVTPRATELLGLASPLAADAPIWKELRALGDRWRAARPAPLFLNHLYRVVDKETFAALEGSAFLRDELGVSETRTTVRADRSYSGLYVYGQRTYFEFLPPEAQPDLGVGSTGLAFGLERAGASEVLQRGLGELEVAAQVFPITRALDGAQVPWFRMLSFAPVASSRLGLFTMEYEPAFLARWHPAGDAGGSLRRSDVLERYATVLSQDGRRRDAPLGDVIEVELALAPAEEAQVLALCAAAGYEVEGEAGDRSCHGPQFRLRLRSSATPGGITAFTLGLRRPLVHEPLELGSVRIAFEGDRARVTFR